MTQEQKQLLLIDLCARLLYGVKFKHEGRHTVSEILSITPIYDYGNVIYFDDAINHPKKCDIDDIKPYLFPLSSMTDEQCEELNNLIHEHFILDDGFNEGINFKTYGDILVWLDEKPINECYFIFDYFNKNHLDYRGLISMSLALDATGINIY